MGNDIQSLGHALVSHNEFVDTYADVDRYIDTGSYTLNALLSGSIYKGLPGNKITALAGESSTGKTYFTLGVVNQFLKDNPTGGVIFFESESAITKKMLLDRGIDIARLVIVPVATVQQFRHQALVVLEKYMEDKEADRRPLLICLDSLGMLSTTKEMEDSTEGKETKDMTRAAILKAAFRVLTLKLGRAKVPMVVTNHTYDVIGSMYPQKEMGGGCLVSGTKIKTSHGDIEIQNLQIGDKVDTLFGEKCVTNTFKFTDKDVYEIEMTDGTYVKCSAEHKFLIESDDGYIWIAAKDLSEGVDLVGMD
jgi:RecA/RadA recombinase